MKLYNIFDEENNFVKGITVYGQKDLKEVEDFFNKDIDTINADIAEKKSVTTDGKEYTVKLLYTMFI